MIALLKTSFLYERVKSLVIGLFGSYESNNHGVVRFSGLPSRSSASITGPKAPSGFIRLTRLLSAALCPFIKNSFIDPPLTLEMVAIYKSVSIFVVFSGLGFWGIKIFSSLELFFSG